MSVVIYNAHSGRCLQADQPFTSVEELRKWIDLNLKLAPARQIIMNARGKTIKSQTLPNEKELFLFDRKLLDASSTPPTEAIPRLQTPSSFPDSLESETEMSSWRSLFKKRLSWAESVITHAHSLASAIDETDMESRIILRSVQVAFSNLETHSTNLQGSLARLTQWLNGVFAHQGKALEEWEPAVRRLVRIPVHEEFRNYGRDQKVDKKVLGDFFDIKDVQAAAEASRTMAHRFDVELTELEGAIEKIVDRTTDLKMQIHLTKSSNIDETMKILLGELGILVKKVRTDYEYVRELQGPKAASTASKRAYASTSEYLPELLNIISDVGRLLQQTVQQKNSISAACVKHLQSVALIQSISSPVNPQINKLDAAYQEEDASFHLLSMVVGFPRMYGSLLVECVRRREWSEKFSNDTKRLAEGLALIKDDEEKRRKKWYRDTGSVLPFEMDEASQIVRAELNTRGDLSGGLPKITRQDVEAFMATIKTIEGMEGVYKEVGQMYTELDKPMKKHNKLLKGFKMGSVHEAQMAASSMFGRNDEVVKTLRDEKEKLAERVRSYESRIRKLEDLLHRGRTSTANGYQPVGSPSTQPPTTPQSNQQPPPFPSNNPATHSEPPDQPNSGPASISSRRVSYEGAGDRALAAKVVALEAALASEKEVIAKLQQEASARSDAEKDMNDRISQADDTKRDLVANLEALDQQHVNERKEFERELEELKLKLDDAYTEIDRLEESRAEELEEKALIDEKARGLEGELRMLTGMVEDLRLTNEEQNGKRTALEKVVAALTREKELETAKLRHELEEQTKRAEEEIQRAAEAEAALNSSEKANTRLVDNMESFQNQIRQMKEALNANKLRHVESQESIASALNRAHRQLSAEAPSEDLDILMDKIEALITDSVSRNKELAAKLEEERSKTTALESSESRLQSRFDSRTIKAKELTQRLYTHNARSMQLLESLGYRIVRGENSTQIMKVSRSTGADSTILAHSTVLPATSDPSRSVSLTTARSSSSEDISLLYWMETDDSEVEAEKYEQYLKTISDFDLDAFSDAVVSRVKKAEQDARQIMKQGRAYRDKYYRARDEASEKIAFKSFKAGDLALFLPTRNQVTRPWAAFNVGAPHFFLREQDAHKLGGRDWLLARISKVEERVVDLSTSTASLNLPPSVDKESIHSNDGASIDEENPFELSDGLRWYLLDAVEEKPGAPSTPGLSTSTVAAANVDAKGSLRSRKPVIGAKKTLSQITTGHSRRSSSGSGHVAYPGLTSSDATAAIAAVRATLEEGGSSPAVVEVAATSPPVARDEYVIEHSRKRSLEKLGAMVRTANPIPLE